MAALLPTNELTNRRFLADTKSFVCYYYYWTDWIYGRHFGWACFSSFCTSGLVINPCTKKKLQVYLKLSLMQYCFLITFRCWEGQDAVNSGCLPGAPNYFIFEGFRYRGVWLYMIEVIRRGVTELPKHKQSFWLWVMWIVDRFAKECCGHFFLFVWVLNNSDFPALLFVAMLWNRRQVRCSRIEACLAQYKVMTIIALSWAGMKQRILRKGPNVTFCEAAPLSF